MSGNTRSRRDVEWADGIRGIAAVCVVMSHTVRAFLPNYLSPADDEHATPHLFQRPFFRLTASGPFMISIFFLLSGYVCAIKPIRLSNAGMVDEARKVIASSAFRRVLRIGLPATFGTIFAWGLTQIGAFTLAPHVEMEGMWLVASTPKRVPGIFAPLYALIRACFNTWAEGNNYYESNQWSLAWEMRGAMMVFLTLSVGVCCTPFWRRFMLVFMATFYFKSGEFIPPFLFFAGAVLAEITQMQIAYAKNSQASPLDPVEPLRGWRKYVNNYWTIALFFVSYFLGTQPPSNPERATYSRVIFNFFKNYITTRGGQPDRTCAAVAGIGMILSIMFSPALKRFFSQPIFVFFGSISFPLYLLHGIFIRGPLAWALFRLLPSLPWLPARDSKTLETLVVRRDCTSFICLSSALGICFIWFALLVLFCRFWKNRIDIYGVTLSKWGEEVVMGKRPFGTSTITTVTGTAMMELAKRLKGESSTTTSEKYGNGMLS